MELDVDFSKCMTWNVKVVYMFVYAEYETSENWLTQVTLWDKILEQDKVQAGKVELGRWIEADACKTRSGGRMVACKFSFWSAAWCR